MKTTRAWIAGAMLSILVGQAAFAAVASPRRFPEFRAESHGPFSYQHPCTPLLQHSLSAVLRGASFGHVGTDITGAIGDATVRQQGPCTNPTATAFDLPAVIPATLQVSETTTKIVQLGWMKCGKISGQVCGTNIPPDGNQHFFYVCNDTSGGEPCDANSWAGAPINGRRYRFQVRYNQLGTGKWDYSIKDLTTGITKTKSITSTWHNANGAWFGAENFDNGSVMASAHIGGNDIAMYWMQYYRTSVGAWTVVTDISATQNPPDFVEAGSQPSWYGYNIFNQNYTLDGVHIWSADHS